MSSTPTGPPPTTTIFFAFKKIIYTFSQVYVSGAISAVKSDEQRAEDKVMYRVQAPARGFLKQL